MIGAVVHASFSERYHGTQRQFNARKKRKPANVYTHLGLADLSRVIDGLPPQLLTFRRWATWVRKLLAVVRFTWPAAPQRGAKNLEVVDAPACFPALHGVTRGR